MELVYMNQRMKYTHPHPSTRAAMENTKLKLSWGDIGSPVTSGIWALAYDQLVTGRKRYAAYL